MLRACKNHLFSQVALGFKHEQILIPHFSTKPHLFGKKQKKGKGKGEKQKKTEEETLNQNSFTRQTGIFISKCNTKGFLPQF